MDVFLVPVGADRYELYAEADAPLPPDRTPARRTLWSRAVESFHRALAEGQAHAEAERAGAAGGAPPPHGRLRRAITTRLANAVAEQRLLWHLRDAATAGLVYPDALTAARALDLTRALLAADLVRHRRWCAIDGVIALLTVPVALLPGPNVLGYYFVFRAVGHLFAWRGARHGLHDVTWQCRPGTQADAAPLYTRGS